MAISEHVYCFFIQILAVYLYHVCIISNRLAHNCLCKCILALLIPRHLNIDIDIELYSAWDATTNIPLCRLIFILVGGAGGDKRSDLHLPNSKSIIKYQFNKKVWDGGEEKRIKFHLTRITSNPQHNKFRRQLNMLPLPSIKHSITIPWW